MEAAAHEVEGWLEVQPIFEGKGTLVEEEREAVRAAGTVVGGIAEEARFRWGVDRIVDEMMGFNPAGGKGGGVGSFEADGGGVDDEFAGGESFFKMGIIEGEGFDAVARSGEGFAVIDDGEEVFFEVLNFIEGAVDEDELGAVVEEALGGDGASGTSAGSDDDDFQGAEIEGKFLEDGAAETGAVGVEAGHFPGFVEDDGIDGAHELGGGIDVVAGFEGFEFVGDGDVDAADSGIEKGAKAFGDGLGWDFDADVAGILVEGIEGGLVELGGKGVGDGRADHGVASGEGLIEIELGEI